MGAALDVCKGFVDGNPLNEGREIADHLDGGIVQPLVVAEMAADKSELRTEFACLPSWHAAVDPEGLCHGNEGGIERGQGLIGSHAAATASNHWAAASALKIRSVDREMRWR